MRYLQKFSNRGSLWAYIVMAFLLSTVVLSCAPPRNPVLEKIQSAFENEDRSPEVVYQILTQELEKIKDKEAIELLLNYFEDRRNSPKVYFNNVGIVVFYLERITGLQSHVDLTFAGPLYYDKSNWDKDIVQWRKWWDANKDYIYWDDQLQMFKVRSH